MSKSIKVIACLAFVVFLALAVTKIEATRFIEYPDLIAGDHSLGCNKLHPQTCKKQEANPYRVGCIKKKRCRT